MSDSRQQRFGPALRFCAATMVFVWLAATSFCSAEHLLFGHAESGGAPHADGAAHHSDEAAPSSADSNHSHDSDKNHDEKSSCCDSLKTTPQLGHSVVLTKPDFGKSLSFIFLWMTQTLTLVQPDAPISRQPPDRQWVFAPEVSLGPAFRSHAPPVLA